MISSPPSSICNKRKLATSCLCPIPSIQKAGPFMTITKKIPSCMVASPQPLRTGKCMTPKCWRCLKHKDWGRNVKDLGWWFCCIQAVVATKTAWLKSEHSSNRMLQRNSRNERRFVMIHVNSILPHVQKKPQHIHGKVVQEISPFQSGMSLKTEVFVYVSNMSDLMGWNFHGEAMFEIAALSSGMLLQ